MYFVWLFVFLASLHVIFLLPCVAILVLMRFAVESLFGSHDVITTITAITMFGLFAVELFLAKVCADVMTDEPVTFLDAIKHSFRELKMYINLALPG